MDRQKPIDSFDFNHDEPGGYHIQAQSSLENYIFVANRDRHLAIYGYAVLLYFVG